MAASEGDAGAAPAAGRDLPAAARAARSDPWSHRAVGDGSVAQPVQRGSLDFVLPSRAWLILTAAAATTAYFLINRDGHRGWVRAGLRWAPSGAERRPLRAKPRRRLLQPAPISLCPFLLSDYLALSNFAARAKSLEPFPNCSARASMLQGIGQESDEPTPSPARTLNPGGLRVDGVSCGFFIAFAFSYVVKITIWGGFVGSHCICGAVKQHLCWVGIRSSLLELFWWRWQLCRASCAVLAAGSFTLLLRGSCSRTPPRAAGGRMCRGHRGAAPRLAAFADLLLPRVCCCGFAFPPRCVPEAFLARGAAGEGRPAVPRGARGARAPRCRGRWHRARPAPARLLVRGASRAKAPVCVAQARAYGGDVCLHTHTRYKRKYTCLQSRSLLSVAAASVSAGSASGAQAGLAARPVPGDPRLPQRPWHRRLCRVESAELSPFGGPKPRH